jgi:hypothetical protein
MVAVSDGSCDLVSMRKASEHIIKKWSPELFAKNMLKAAAVAINNHKAKKYMLDDVILHFLTRQ